MKKTAYENYCLLRDKLGYTDYKVAKETGIGTATMSNWKNGKYVPKTDKIQKIASLLGTTEKFIIEGIEPTESNSAELTKKDERDIAKDMENIRNKLKNNEEGPASYDGQTIPEEDIDLLLGQIELMMRRLKPINKEKYNPNKNKK